ncbi:MAG: hypothetical protein ABR985_21690 [Methanotrichaceae archaeon]
MCPNPKWTRRAASKFDATYYRGLLETAGGEAAFVLEHMTAKDQSV